MSKTDDNQFYLDAVTEFEGKNRDPALWAKCVTLAEGDEEKAKYQYLKESVEKFKSKSVEDKRTEINTTLEGKYFLTNLKEGNHSLFKTYWIYYVLVEFIIALMMRIITQIFEFGNYNQGFIFSSVIFFTYLVVYKRLVWMGIWRAANRYEGNKIWSFLAKFAVVISVLITIIAAYFIVENIHNSGNTAVLSSIPMFSVLAVGSWYIVIDIYRNSI